MSFPLSSRPSLLVVDNHLDFISLVERYLSEEGWTVLGASDYDSALRICSNESVRAVLLDVVLPERDGWELLVALRAQEKTKSLPVIICSVLHEPGVAASLDASGYLQKPIDRTTLVRTLGKLTGFTGRA